MNSKSIVINGNCRSIKYDNTDDDDNSNYNDWRKVTPNNLL